MASDNELAVQGAGGLMDADDIKGMLQSAAFSIANLGSQMGVVTSAISQIQADHRELVATVQDNTDKIARLENDGYITESQLRNLDNSGRSRVSELLSIQRDEYGNDLTDESAYCSVAYFGKFMARLWNDGVKAGVIGKPHRTTTRGNYTAALDFIDKWVPERGVDGYKSHLDLLAAAKLKRAADIKAMAAS